MDIDTFKFNFTIFWTRPVRDYLETTNNETNSLFDARVTADFCKRHSFGCVIRGGELLTQGFSQDHAKCFSVFSASDYYACGNRGAVLKLTSHETDLEPYVYMNISSNRSGRIKSLLMEVLRQDSDSLRRKCESLDTSLSGYVSVNEWTNLIAEHFSTTEILASS